MKKIKYFCLFIGILLLYFIPSLIFKNDKNFYINLNKPFYAPSPILFSICWVILYIINSIFIVISIKNKDKENISLFIINYIIAFFFNYFFFIKHNLFLSFCDTFLCFVTESLIVSILYKKNRYQALCLTPYLLWTFFASILMCHIYFIN